MTRFKFRLAKLQKLAERKAREAAGQFSDARRVLLERERVQENIEQQRAKRGRPYPETGDQLRVDVMTSLQTHLVKLTADVKRAAAEVRAQALTVEQKRQGFVGAKREERKFELLRQRRFEEWQLQMNRREQRMLDEVAGRRHGTAGVAKSADIAQSHGKDRRND